MKDEINGNIDDEVNKYELYELENIILDEKEWRKRVFES